LTESAFVLMVLVVCGQAASGGEERALPAQAASGDGAGAEPMRCVAFSPYVGRYDPSLGPHPPGKLIGSRSGGFPCRPNAGGRFRLSRQGGDPDRVRLADRAHGVLRDQPIHRPALRCRVRTKSAPGHPSDSQAIPSPRLVGRGLRGVPRALEKDRGTGRALLGYLQGFQTHSMRGFTPLNRRGNQAVRLALHRHRREWVWMCLVMRSTSI
jgi:hypothetical protein